MSKGDISNIGQYGCKIIESLQKKQNFPFIISKHCYKYCYYLAAQAGRTCSVSGRSTSPYVDTFWVAARSRIDRMRDKGQNSRLDRQYSTPLGDCGIPPWFNDLGTWFTQGLQQVAMNLPVTIQNSPRK